MVPDAGFKPGFPPKADKKNLIYHDRRSIITSFPNKKVYFFRFCQEIPDDLDSDTQQGPQHFTTSATRSDRKRVHVENSIFSRKLRSKE